MFTLSIVKTLISATGGVTEVKTDIFVTSFGPVSDVEMVRYWCCKKMYVLPAGDNSASVTTNNSPYRQAATRLSNEL